MRQIRFDGTFTAWRAEARRCLLAGLTPDEVVWLDVPGDRTGDLFGTAADDLPAQPGASLRIPRELPALLQLAARFRCEARWSLLYRVLWRASRGDRSALLAGDPDGSLLQRRAKAVRRELHHLHAFVRFRPLGAPAEHFVAWHEPAHDVLELAIEHFARRMGGTPWMIATPQAAALWDGRHAALVSPCPPTWRALAQTAADPDEALWLAYYRSIFNPARANREALLKGLPARFWKDLPEGTAICELLVGARNGDRRTGQAAALVGRAGRRIGREARGLAAGQGEVSVRESPDRRR